MATRKHINNFLLNGGDDDNIIHHRHDCFCSRCRRYYRSLIEVKYGQSDEERKRQIRELGSRMFDELPKKLEAAKKNVFSVTKELIVNGGLYRDASLRGSRYTQFKSWAKHQPRYQQWVNGSNEEKTRFDEHCKLINDCANVYESWDTIVNHLTDVSITYLSAETFSVDYFRRAQNWLWCVEENERAAPRGGKRKRPAAEKLWTTQDVVQTARHILGVNRMKEADVFEMAQFCQQVQRQCLQMVRGNQRLNLDTSTDLDTTNASNMLSP